MATVFPPSRPPLDEEQATEKATEHNTDQRHDPQSANHHDGKAFKQQVDSLTSMWNRFNGKGKRKVGLLESLKAIILSSYLNIFLLFIPFAWAAHFVEWSFALTFSLCFLSIIPLEKLFDWGGEQMAIYLGTSLGDLLIVTLNNAVEVTLAIILLRKCQLRVLQSTIVGVVVLHLLLVPGTAFLAGGSEVWEQHLHPHLTQLNHSLLTIGVLSLLLPTAYFSALNKSLIVGSTNVVTDDFRGQFLLMSRGTAIILLVIYIGSRIFLYNPPGEANAGTLHPSAPQALHDEERELALKEPEVNSWVCVVMLVITIAIMAVTAEFLVESIEIVRETGNIREEWFGVILLPLVSFSADGTVAVVFFVHTLVRRFIGSGTVEVPSELAKARAIDLSIQFTLFWMPFLVLLAWWTNSPLSLLFDLYEVALLVGSTFLVNYITQDAKTNWVEGLTMVGFYTMIALWTWFYEGQPELAVMLNCPGTVAEAVAALGGSA